MNAVAGDFDVVVIGAGPAGYPAAIRAAQNGLTVACIDAWKNRDGSAAFGGTCLNAGCIPSKALLESSELYERARSEFAVHGIRAGAVTLDLAAMQQRRAGIVRSMTGGVAALLKSAGVRALHGTARLLPQRRIEVTDPEGARSVLGARHVILAPGSVPVELPALRFDHRFIIDSRDALELDATPSRLIVIGAGVIGLELGSVWRRLGSEVIVLEALEEFLAIADQQLAREALRHLRKQGLDIRLGARVWAASVAGDQVSVRYSDQGGQEQSAVAERVIVAVGRRPCSSDLFAPECGIGLDARGFILVDGQCRTGAEGVWAIGDCVRGPMLAHKGREEGIAVADRIAGRYAHVDYEIIPSVIYTTPEIAWVGRSEEQLKADGIDYKSGVFPFAASGRARAMQAAAGFVKILAERASDRLLGVHIIGPMAGELIAEATLAMAFQASAEDLQRTIHAHPTLAEALHESALAADGRAIDSLNR